MGHQLGKNWIKNKILTKINVAIGFGPICGGPHMGKFSYIKVVQHIADIYKYNAKIC